MSDTYQTCVAELSGGDAAPSTEELLQCISNKFDSGFTDTIDSTHYSIDTFFLLFAATLVFFMQTGFAMLCAGCVQHKNVQNTLLKNLLDACGASLGFYTVGYAFAFGGSSDPENTGTTFIGLSNFFLMGVEHDSFWLFQFAFCATSATIVAGTLAERCRMGAYLGYSIMLSAFVYPVVVHSIWSPNGFLSASNANPLWGVGMVDFAGSTVVHLTGGVTALIATKVLGPRAGRFYDLRGNVLDEPKVFPGHSLALQMLGTFILWFGWYGFNTGSILSVTEYSSVVGHTAITTTLAAATGAVTSLFLHTFMMERISGEVTFNLQYAMNGCLSGLVSVTAGCSVVTSWASIIIGFVGGILYLATSKLLVKRKIDDAVDAIPVHMVNGIWGTIAVGLLAEPTLMNTVYGSSDHVGWFYSWGRGSADGTLLACQLVGILFTAAWVSVLMAPFFLILNYAGWLRVDSLEEVVGLDIGYSGGTIHNRINAQHDEVESNMDEYVKEYLKRKEARLYLKKDTSMHKRGSFVGQSNSGGGNNPRIIRGIEHMDWGKEYGGSDANNRQSGADTENEANDNSSGNLNGAAASPQSVA